MEKRGEERNDGIRCEVASFGPKILFRHDIFLSPCPGSMSASSVANHAIKKMEEKMGKKSINVRMCSFILFFLRFTWNKASRTK